MFRTILSPTDGSIHATRATAIAVDLATKYQARLILVHVLPSDVTAEEIEDALGTEEVDGELKRQIRDLHTVTAPIPVGAGLAPTQAPRALIQKVGRRILDRDEHAARRAGVAEVKAILTEGNPAKRILAVAEAEHADLIVMGSRGLGSVRSVLQGSVSQRIRHICHCACLTVT